MQSEMNDSMFTCSSVRFILFLVIMLPNAENDLSAAVEVAWIHKYFMASLANRG